MKVKLYIGRVLKVGLGGLGFVVFTFAASHALAGGTEDALFEALGERGGLSESSPSSDEGTRGVEAKALHFKLSETLWKSSEAASEHAASGFIMGKLDVLEHGVASQFVKEDYFDDFREKYEKETADKVARDILRDNKESKIERIALAAERGEGRRAEKAQRNEDKVEKAQVKEEKKAEKAEAKEEKRAEKADDDDKDKGDKKDEGGGDGGKKGKGK